MRLVWSDGFFIEKKLGSSLVGHVHNNKRPEKIIVKRSEFENWGFMNSEMFIRYLLGDMLTCAGKVEIVR